MKSPFGKGQWRLKGKGRRLKCMIHGTHVGDGVYWYSRSHENGKQCRYCGFRLFDVTQIIGRSPGGAYLVSAETYNDVPLDGVLGVYEGFNGSLH